MQIPFINQKKEKILTANEYLNIRDIRDKFLYTNDGYIFSYINITGFNVSLFTKKEKKQISWNLSSSISNYKYPFKFLAISRAVNISELLNQYKNMMNQTKDPIRRDLIRQEIDTLAHFATAGEVTERLFYIALFTQYYEGCEKEFIKSVMEFKNIFENNNINAQILNEVQINQMVNLFLFQ